MSYPYPPPVGGQPAARDAAAPARRRGPHLGPFRITPLRVTLVIALGGGIAFLAYATFVRDQLQVPLMATGFAVLRDRVRGRRGAERPRRRPGGP